jgi:hypothetical protein
LPNIDKINNVAVASISKVDAVTFAHGQKVNNQDVSLVQDNHVLIEEQVAFSNQSTITFDELEQGTYNALMFQFINIHADTNDADFRFASTESDDYVNSTYHNTYHDEADTEADHEYDSTNDVELNDDSAIALLNRNNGDVSDESASGWMWIYGLDNDHSLVKQWYSVFSTKSQDDKHFGTQTGGSILHDGTSAAAITGIEFTMSTGTFDGTIKLFGLAEA